MFHRNHKNPLTSEEVSEKREKKRGEEVKQERERKRMGMKEGWKGGKQNKAEVSDF